MKRADNLQASRVAQDQWRLDWSSASYASLHLRPFTCISHTIPSYQENRPDLIAYFLYGDPSLWWLLCFYNKIIDPLSELTTGTTIQVPDYAQLLDYLSSRNTANQTSVLSTVEV